MNTLAPEYQATRTASAAELLHDSDLDLVRLAYAVEAFRRPNTKKAELAAPNFDPSLWSDFLGIWSEAR